MTLEARRVALQGIGYGALAVALQGLVAVSATPLPVLVFGGSTVKRRLLIPRHDRGRGEEELMLLVMAALHLIDPI